MPVYQFEGVTPIVDASAFVDPTAVLIGDVTIGAECFVGPTAVLRGDLAGLVMKRGSNLQDGCVVHSFPGYETVLEENAHIGHGAVIHGCTIGRNTMVGINAVVMDEAHIGEESFVAALAFVRAGMQVPPRTLVVGAPARIVRELRDDEIARKLHGTQIYHHLSRRYKETLRPVEALHVAEPDRPRLPDLPDVPKSDQ